MEQPKARYALMSIAFAALVLVILWSNGVFSRGATADPAPASTAAPAIRIGGEARIVADADEVLIATTEESYDAFNRALATNDHKGVTALLLRGALLAVPKNTRVRVLAGGLSRVQVRVLEGEHAGASGWVALEFVKP